MSNLYHDYRTERIIRDLLVFPCNAAPFECSYSPGYFNANSEHVTIETMPDGHTWARNDYMCYGVRPLAPVRDVTPPDADDSLHPWERDLVANGEPFARPSNRVQS